VTVLFVHGVPDTHRLWRPVLDCLGDGDFHALFLPGLDAPVPEGFDCTMNAYAGWLEGRLAQACERAGGPVHLVGHDWGAMLVQRVAGLNPERVRSWAAGGIAIDEDYVWHDIAQVWQTPGEGEALMAAMDEAAIVQTLMEARIPEARAREMAAFTNDAAKAAILALYRSAVAVGQDWKDALPGLAKAEPGLVLWGEHDPYAAPSMGEKLAARTGARFHMFEDCGHWWPYERAEETARLLKSHWAGA